MEINAAVFRKVHDPLTIESIDIDKPWGREVLVRTAATGVCHSDLHVVDGQGRFPLDRPIVLGHEGAGVVEAVGADVTTVEPGDHVVACLSGFCGNCPQCLSGHPNLCTGGIVTRPDNAAPRLSQKGRPFSQFIGISSYGKGKTTSGQVQLTKDLDAPIEGHHVIIVEDILDTGITLNYLTTLMAQRKPKSLRIVTLLDKPERRQSPVKANYIGFTIPDEFVVGYGLDYAEDYRNLKDVCVMGE